MKRFWSLEKTGYLLAAALLATTSFACGGGDTRVDCDDGEVYQDGECVDVGSFCGPNTSYEDGQCVAEEPVECGLNTQLDPNSNECAVTDEVCGGHTAYDSETDSCVPTSEVCQDGTVFDAEAGLCFASAECQPGDVVVEGFCLSPAAALAANADVDAGGANSNPDEGGTPHSLPMGGIDETTVFKGTIIDPAEVKDGELAQHYDFFSFSAQEGDWFEISVQSLGLPSPHFEVWLSYDGDLHWYRSASAYTGNDKVRQIVVPQNAQVVVQVGPEPAFWGAMPIGGEGWDYVGSVKQIAVPEATPHQFSEGNLNGTLGRLDTNYFLIGEHEPGTAVNFTIAEPAENAGTLVQVWASATEFIAEFDSSFNVDVPSSGELFLIADWDLAIGNHGLEYEVSGREIMNLQPGGVYTRTVAAEDFDVLEVRQNNESTVNLQVTVAEQGGGTILEQELLRRTATGANTVARFIGLSSGNYEVTITNAGETVAEDFVAYIDVITPSSIDDFDLTYSGEAEDNTRGKQEYWLVNSSDALEAEITLARTSGTGSAKFFIYGQNDELYFRHGSNALANPISTLFAFQANTPYIIRVGNDLTSTLHRTFEYDLDLEELIWYPGASVTVNDGDVIEMTQPGSSTLNIRLRDADGTVYADTLAGTGTAGSVRRYIAAEAGTYTVYTTVDGASVSLNTIVPTVITDMSQTLSGASNETLIFDQSFYLVQLPETATYDVQITHTGGSGWARAYIYGLGYNELASHSANATSSNSVQTFEFTFEANTIYVIRVGMNNTGTFDWNFTYNLDFN